MNETRCIIITLVLLIPTCEAQVSATDFQTVPTVATGVSKPLCCRLTLTFTLTSENLSLYITLLLYWSLYNHAARAVDIFIPNTVVQCIDNHSWGLYCRRCCCICVCWGHLSRIFNFSRWLGQLVNTVLTKDESPHTVYIFTPSVVSFIPPSMDHSVGGASILRLIRRKICWDYIFDRSPMKVLLNCTWIQPIDTKPEQNISTRRVHVPWYMMYMPAETRCGKKISNDKDWSWVGDNDP